MSKEIKPSASMLGLGFERVRGSGDTSVGGITTIGVTGGRFLCFRRCERGAMSKELGDQKLNRNLIKINVCFQMPGLLLHTQVSEAWL